MKNKPVALNFNKKIWLNLEKKSKENLIDEIILSIDTKNNPLSDTKKKIKALRNILKYETDSFLLNKAFDGAAKHFEIENTDIILVYYRLLKNDKINLNKNKVVYFSENIDKKENKDFFTFLLAHSPDLVAKLGQSFFDELKALNDVKVNQKTTDVAGKKDLSNLSQNTGKIVLNTLKDTRDDKRYFTVKIGDQTWMAEDLAFKIDQGCWIIDPHNAGLIPNYYYTLEAAKKACPIGWRLPTEKDFKTLVEYYNNDASVAYKELIMNGNSGFNGNFNGLVDDGYLEFYGRYAYFISSSEYEGGVTDFVLDSMNKSIKLLWHNKEFGFSVRCIKE